MYTSFTSLPMYRSHKLVGAVKIETLVRDGEGENRETDGSAMINGSIKVDHAYMFKHKPEIGGYYVEYEDGYKSFSPAEAFENGYTKI